MPALSKDLVLRLRWLLVPALVLTAALAGLWQRGRVPDRADWREAAAVVKAELKPGDGVAWTPYWAGEGRLFMHGLPAFHLLDVKHADLSRYERLWLLGAFGHDADDLPEGHELIERQSFGGVTLDLVKVGGERVVADLYANLERAKVSRKTTRKGTRRCNFWDGRGWHCDLKKSASATRRCLAQSIAKRHAQRRRDPYCGLNPWLNVSRDVRVIGGGPRRCVWFHPSANATTTIVWPTDEVGELVIDYGFTDKVLTDHTRKGTRVKAAKLRVKRGRETIGEVEIKPERGWHRARFTAGGAGALSFELTTTSTTDAHLCFDPTIRRAP